MKPISTALKFAAAALLVLGGSAFAQETVFSHPDVNYSFSVPDAKWRITSRPSATSPNVELVYGDRRDGHLEVRRLTVGKNAILFDVIQDEEAKHQFLRGFVAGKEENFAGKLRGSVFNFEYVQDGRSMTGRHYFLRADDTTVYVLRFTGQKDALRMIRNQTDSIARTFGVHS
jgi:hypothetical protein